MLKHKVCQDPWATLSKPGPTNLQEVITEAFIAFEGRPAGKEASPELVGAIGIGEEVILFHHPAAAEALRAGS